MMDGYVLGFDYGVRRIGVAVGQTLTCTARPLANLPSRRDKPDWDGIGRLIQQWQPARVVVGLPLFADGTQSPMSDAAQRFARQLEGRYRLPVVTINEYLSSREAAQRDPAASEIDAIAAQVILETWLHETCSMLPA